MTTESIIITLPNQDRWHPVYAGNEDEVITVFNTSANSLDAQVRGLTGGYIINPWSHGRFQSSLVRVNPRARGIDHCVVVRTDRVSNMAIVRILPGRLQRLYVGPGPRRATLINAGSGVLHVGGSLNFELDPWSQVFMDSDGVTIHNQNAADMHCVIVFDT